MGLFKTREERAESNFNKGADMISQRNYSGALYYLQKSIDNGNATPDVYVLTALLRLRENCNDPGRINSAIAELSKYPNVTVKYGVYDVNSSDVIEECKLKLELSENMKMFNAGSSSQELAKALINCGNRYQMQYGDSTLLLESIFDEKKITGRERSLEPIAIGYEMLSDAVKWEDPRKASEYLQKASMYRSEGNNVGGASEDERRQEWYSKTARCWFCGKEVCGQDIHFVAMPAKITSPIMSQADGPSPIKSNGPDEIYVCRACFSAMDNLAKEYLRAGEEYTDRAAADLQMQINCLRAQIESVRVSAVYRG